MWKMSVQWSLKENAESFRGPSADDDLVTGAAGDQDKKDAPAGKESKAEGSSSPRPR